MLSYICWRSSILPNGLFAQWHKKTSNKTERMDNSDNLFITTSSSHACDPLIDPDFHPSLHFPCFGMHVTLRPAFKSRENVVDVLDVQMCGCASRGRVAADRWAWREKGQAIIWRSTDSVPNILGLLDLFQPCETPTPSYPIVTVFSFLLSESFVQRAEA